MKITQSNGNAKNGIQGCRLRYWVRRELIGELSIPTRNGPGYLAMYPNGDLARRHRDIVQSCRRIEKMAGISEEDQLPKGFKGKVV